MAKKRVANKKVKINEARQLRKIFTITALVVVAALAVIFVFFFNR